MEMLNFYEIVFVFCLAFEKNFFLKRYMMSRGYSIRVSFINRKRELEFLENWVDKEPNSILFLYGPKSSGKTTLLYRFVEGLDRSRYEVKDFNLRKYVISSYRDFLSVFFGIDFSKSRKDVKEKRQYNLRVFKLAREVYKGLENMEYDAFDIMEKELIGFRERGKSPIILIDELQALEDIYINGQRELIKEVFNFFIAMTKESHLAHVIVASSDGYFIEKIYTHSKLNKTSRLLEVDYLDKDSIYYWLENIDKENNIKSYRFSKEQIDLIWDRLGGSIWEIDDILQVMLLYARDGRVSTEVLSEELARIIHANYVKIVEYPGIYYGDELNLKVARFFREKGEFSLRDFLKVEGFEKGKLLEELGDLVRHNFLYYNPMTGKYKPQGRSFYWAYLKYEKEFN